MESGALPELFMLPNDETKRNYISAIKDTISGNCKYYINDLSFKNYLYPGFSYGAGYKLENLIYLELRRAGYNTTD